MAAAAAVLVSGLAAGTAPAPATTPGHNGLIVFSAETDQGVQLFTVRPNGSHLEQITQVDGDAAHADWSSDGRYIVFELGDADHAGVAIVRKDGSGLRDLTPTGFQGNPAFTPDGRHIVFEKFVEPDDDSIWIMRRDGTGQRQLTHNPFPGVGWDTDPNVSPNGKVVTFVRVKEPEVLQALFAVNIDGTHLRQLTSYSLEVGIKHDWAPDGSRIAVITHADRPVEGQSSNVATIRPDGTGLKMVTDYQGGVVNAFTGSFSPNGRWIVYRVDDDGAYTLSKAHPDGSHPQSILPLDTSPRYIDWGPTTG